MSTVPGEQSSHPSETEVARIVAVEDPASRNRQITETYWKLSAEVERRILGHANWCTFATWASRQAGVTIRNEDATDTLRHRLQRSWKFRGVFAKLIWMLVEGELNLLQVVINSVSDLGPLKRSSHAVAVGNRKVFEEIGFQFARWLKLFPDIGSATDSELESFCQTLTPGPPPDGQDLLRQAFTNYRAAVRATDAKEKAELMLLANLQIGFHEQTRLQPNIKAALDAALLEPDDLAKLLMDELGARQGKIARAVNAVWPFKGSPLEKVIKALSKDLREKVRILITEQLMSLWLPPQETVRLGRDLTRPYPEVLQKLTNPDVLHLLVGFDAASESERGSGAEDWANLKQRMRFIAGLFRAYGDDRHLFDPVPTNDAAGVVAQ